VYSLTFGFDIFRGKYHFNKRRRNNMLIHSASQLLTLAGGPQRDNQLGTLGIIQNGAVLIQNGLILEVGSTDQLLKKYPDESRLDAEKKVVMPGFVDPHTHLIFAGDRAREFEMRLKGMTYMQILAAGGGILSTVSATRAASGEELTAQLKKRGRMILRFGTTTCEVKTGYGLTVESELLQLKLIANYQDTFSPDLRPTFLGAHAVPPEYKDDPWGYTNLVNSRMLPEILEIWKVDCPGKPLPFVDVFCEQGAFNLEQSRSILETAKSLGFPLKVHADEFENLGGASMAAQLGAVSADHLVKTSMSDITALAASSTVAVSLPCTPFGLGETEYTPALAIIEAGGMLALASDFNPGTAWCGNMQFVIALACRYMKLTPAEAIAAATINAAAAIRSDSLIGSIEPGKKAHLLILNVDDYRQLGYQFSGNLVHTVIKDEYIIENEDED
jgi:imidazolonepropionase